MLQGRDSGEKLRRRRQPERRIGTQAGESASQNVRPNALRWLNRLSREEAASTAQGI
jgi:hypothetical protein